MWSGARCAVYVITLLWLVLGQSASCNKQPAAPPATLPPNWPIPELTLPADATEYVIAFNVRTDPGETSSYRPKVVVNQSIDAEVWLVGFQTSLSEVEVRKHIESALRGKGFLRFGDASEMDSPRVYDVGYCTPDGLMEVSITHIILPEPGLENDKYDGWTLEVMSLERPRTQWDPDLCKPIE